MGSSMLTSMGLLGLLAFEELNTLVFCITKDYGSRMGSIRVVAIDIMARV